jgi:exodeoxyribonuclease VII large subunit
VYPCALSFDELSKYFSTFSLEQVEAPSSLTPESKGLSVSELTARISQAIRSAFPRSVLVYGVISSLKSVGERVFLDLMEKEKPDESLSCVIWRNVEALTAGLRSAGFTLENDLDVMFEVEVELRKNGRVSLQILRIVEEYTIAKAAAQREITNRKLKEEGLIDRNRTLALAFLPRRFGVLTSAAGTVINDFLAPLNEVQFGFELFWFHVNVQGATSREQIVRGIERLSALEDLDAIILFRGGGSAADLAVFNDYSVARAICLCPLPVLSAIGHEQDVTSAQDVSFRAFGVPKDLGHFLARTVIDIRAAFAEYLSRSALRTDTLLEHAAQGLSAITQLLSARSSELLSVARESSLRLMRELPLSAAALIRLTLTRVVNSQTVIVAASRTVAETRKAFLLRAAAQGISLAAAAVERTQDRAIARTDQLVLSFRHLVERATARLDTARSIVLASSQFITRTEGLVDTASARVESASPRVQLERGFAIVRHGEEKREVALRANALSPSEQIEIEFFDGPRSAVVK